MSALPGKTPLGIVAGGGELPLRVAHAARAAGRPVAVVVVEGWGDPAAFQDFPCLHRRVGAVGEMLDFLRSHGVRQLVMLGTAQRPSLLAIRPDMAAARLLARIGGAYLKGDDGLLRAVAAAVEAEGFEVLAVPAVLQDLLPETGPLTRARPDATARADIARGIAVARALGAVDVGQGCVVQQGLVLAVEAIEGTDAMLARAAGLRREGPGGVLVKLVKPGQDRRVDLPAIGLRTVEGAVAAGLAGIAIEARGGIVVDRKATMAAADAAGLFVVAIDPDDFTIEERAP